jgi:hypothetical protein
MGISFSCSWMKRKGEARRRAGAAKGRHKVNRRLCLEFLEDRTLPSTVTWVGGSGDWNALNPDGTAANWQDDQGIHRLPGPTDNAVISTAGITVTHSSGLSDSVQSLQSLADITLSNGGGLVLGGSSRISGQLSNSASVEILSGTLTLSGGGSSSAGAFVGDSGTTLQFVGSWSLTEASVSKACLGVWTSV